MSRGHRLAGLFLALGITDLLLLNVWLVPAAWPPGGPLAVQTTTDTLGGTHDVKETRPDRHTAVPEPRDGVLVESAGEAVQPKTAAIPARSAEAKLEPPVEPRSRTAAGLVPAPEVRAALQPAATIEPDLAITEGSPENQLQGTAGKPAEPLEQTDAGEPRDRASSPAAEPTLALRDSPEAERPSAETRYKIFQHSVIHFSFGKGSPGSAASNILGQTLKVFREHPHAEIQVDGHTDNRGNQAYNYSLSERRARAAASALEAEGIPAERIQIRGYGPSKPLDTRDIGWARAKNRRVEITVRSRLP